MLIDCGIAHARASRDACAGRRDARASRDSDPGAQACDH
jgi:hypothetical protein